MRRASGPACRVQSCTPPSSSPATGGPRRPCCGSTPWQCREAPGCLDRAGGPLSLVDGESASWWAAGSRSEPLSGREAPAAGLPPISSGSITSRRSSRSSPRSLEARIRDLTSLPHVLQARLGDRSDARSRFGQPQVDPVGGHAERSSSKPVPGLPLPAPAPDPPAGRRPWVSSSRSAPKTVPARGLGRALPASKVGGAGHLPPVREVRYNFRK